MPKIESHTEKKKYDMFFWSYPDADKLVKVPEVDEDLVDIYTNAWLDKSDNTDCMVCPTGDELIVTGECSVRTATNGWIKNNLMANVI